MKEQISFHVKLAEKLKELHRKCGFDSIVDHPIDMMEHPGTVDPESIERSVNGISIKSDS